MRILFLSRWFPYPPDNGSKIRVSNLLRGLSEQHRVTLISFADPEEDVSGKDFPKPAPDEIHTCPYREFDSCSRRSLLGYLSRTPRYLVDTYSPEMETLIRRTIQKTRYDIVIASQLSMASYYRCFQSIPAIFEEVELGIYSPSEAQGILPWTGNRRKLTWWKHRRFVAGLLKNFRLCTVASEVERRILASIAPTFRSVHVIPNSIDLSQYRHTSNGRVPASLIFAGSLRYAPNHDAMTWFLSEIYPAIRTQMPGVCLKITGDPGPLPLPPASNVQLTGIVSDIHSLVETSAVSLAPIRSGGGTRLKVLESLALRTPVVATSKAVEGLEARDGEHLHIADAPREFAQAVLRFLREPEYARKIADNAFKLVQSRYDWRIVLPRFMHLAEQAAAS